MQVQVDVSTTLITRIDRIKNLANMAVFYREGIVDILLRIQYCDEEAGNFCVLDENNGDEHLISYDEVPEGSAFFVAEEHNVDIPMDVEEFLLTQAFNSVLHDVLSEVPQDTSRGSRIFKWFEGSLVEIIWHIPGVVLHQPFNDYTDSTFLEYVRDLVTARVSILRTAYEHGVSTTKV